jgi:hypothetical protein
MLFKIKQAIQFYSLSKYYYSLAICCFLYALYIAIKYANQVPLDMFSFRQTQTALTAYWFVKDGFRLAYQTPVAGPPWSIPFEFPIYQYIVALITKVSGLPLDAVGRIVSFIFLSLCIVPVKSITKNLNLPRSTFYIFTSLLFSSPLYLYWGRTFMIEMAAMFFSVAAVKYFVDIIQEKTSCKNQSLFVIFITLSILQKETTGLPVLAVLCLVYVFLNIKEAKSLKSLLLSRKTISALVYFGLPLAIGIIWTLYTDHVRALNAFGGQLTSSALRMWIWGTLSQRLSSLFYKDVIWRRVFINNLSGWIGIAILMIAMFTNSKNQIKFTIIVSCILGLIPMFLFINLHIIHDYYQTGNVIFLIFAIAVSLGCVISNYSAGQRIVFVLTIIMVASNYHCFSRDYLGVTKTVFNTNNSREYAVSEILKREIPQGKYFVAFGNDWSSSLSYLSERKSFSVPEWFNQYERISLHPEHFVEETNLGAVVICPAVTSPTIGDLIEWSSSGRNWKIGEVYGCYIATPGAPPMNKEIKITHGECQGSIDFAGEVQAGNRKLFSINGRTNVSGENGIAPEKVYITLRKEGSEPIYLETLRVERSYAKAHLDPPGCIDGFSRIVSTNSLAGKYLLGFSRLNQGHLESCQVEKEVLINSASTNQ